jgi:hypothetical protein
MFTLFVFLVVTLVPLAAYLRWPDAWLSRKARALASLGWDWLAEHVMHLPPRKPVAAIAVAPQGAPASGPGRQPAGGRRSSAPLPDLEGDAAKRSAQAAVFIAAAASQGVPAEYVQLAAAIVEYRPEDDLDMQYWYLGHAAGAHAIGDAWFGHVESMVEDVGIDPAFAQTAMMVAEYSADMAEFCAGLAKRLVEVYALVKEHKANDGTLPDDPDFITPDVA